LNHKVGRLIIVDDEAELMTALSEMLAGQGMAEVSDIPKQLYVNPEDRARRQDLMETEGVVRGYEVERRRKAGSRFWVSLTARVVKDGKGNIQYYEGTMEDITHRKRAERRQILVNNILVTLNCPTVKVK